LEGQGTSTGPQPVAQRHARDTAAQLKSHGDELGAPEIVGANKEASVKHPKRNKGCSSMKVTWQQTRMKCLYMNAHSVGNKQEELEATVMLESYDLIALTETWWDESHDSSADIDDYRLFGETGEEGGSEALPFTGRNAYSVKSCP